MILKPNAHQLSILEEKATEVINDQSRSKAEREQMKDLLDQVQHGE